MLRIGIYRAPSALSAQAVSSVGGRLLCPPSSSKGNPGMWREAGCRDEGYQHSHVTQFRHAAPHIHSSASGESVCALHTAGKCTGGCPVWSAPHIDAHAPTGGSDNTHRLMGPHSTAACWHASHAGSDGFQRGNRQVSSREVQSACTDLRSGPLARRIDVCGHRAALEHASPNRSDLHQLESAHH